MRRVSSPTAVQRVALDWRRQGVRIGFVPTMGYLHDGHLSLVHRARQAVGKSGRVIVSIYVNPTQFGAGEDLSRYPRSLARDLALCRAAGVDLVFTPGDAAMYPRRDAGDYSTFVVEERLSQGMEGASRPGHFRGVTTIVAKFFHLVLPEVAIFGAKDWQQAAVVRRMVKDLNFPVKIVVAPTIREADGLAMSSRNTYLEPTQRRQATVLWRAMAEARRVVRSQVETDAALLRARLRELIEAEPAVRLDYVAFFHPRSLEPVTRVRRGTHLALAAFLGKTRLIDNSAL